jgi:hypothetical protein
VCWKLRTIIVDRAKACGGATNIFNFLLKIKELCKANVLYLISSELGLNILLHLVKLESLNAKGWERRERKELSLTRPP